MLAPNQVSAPAAIQTSSMPANVGTALLTSDGCTKIDEPTIVPTTMAVACVRPIVRASLDAIRPAEAVALQASSILRATASARRSATALAERMLSPNRRRLTRRPLIDLLD